MVGDAREGQTASEVKAVSLLAVPASEVAARLFGQVAVAVVGDPGCRNAGSAQQHVGWAALGAQSGVLVDEGAAAALVVALAIPENVLRLAGSAGALRTDSDAVEVLDRASPSWVEHCAGQALQACSAEDEAAREGALAGVPDGLEAGPAGEAVERGVVPRAVGQSAFRLASASLHWAEPLAAGQAAGVVGGKLATGDAVLIAGFDCLHQDQQQKEQKHGTAQENIIVDSTQNHSFALTA